MHIFPLFDPDYLNGGSLGQYFFFILFEGVPIFLAVNGFLLLGKKEIDLRKHYLKTLKIAVLFVLWSLILIIINLLFDKTPINRSVIIDLFLKTGGENSLYTSELWFLQYLIPLYIIYPLLHNAYHHNRKLYDIIFYLTAFFTVGIYFIPLLANLIANEIRAGILRNFYDYLGRSSFLGPNAFYVFYFMLGGEIKRHYETLMKKKYLFAGLGLFSWLLCFGYGLLAGKINGYLVEKHFNNTLMMALMVVGLFALMTDLKPKGIAGKMVEGIGANTLGIYVIHSFIIRIVRLFVPSSLAFNFLSLLLVLIISHLLTLILKKLPVLRELVSF
ncbi:MAG: acyltransferase [Erysipelotrichaceae bacterium]|nr:acyltransferase [Erysipelotrichaceae bacterium]